MLARVRDSPVTVPVCLSSVCVCRLPQVGVLSKRIELIFFAQGLPSTDPTLCYGEIQVSTKLRVLPFGTSSWIPDLENFATAYRSSKRVINLARQRRTLVVTRRSAAKVALPLELRRSTAVVYHSDRLHSVYTTIPSRGSNSDSRYLCRMPISAFGPSYRYAKFHRNQCSSFHDTSIHAPFFGAVLGNFTM